MTTSRFENEIHVNAPTGKQTIRGTIVSTKSKDTDYGIAYRMTVKVTTLDGCYLVNSTIPVAIFDACETSGMANLGGWLAVLRGCEVQFTATLERSDSPHFAFAKRPTKATITNIPADKPRRECRDEEPAEDLFAQFETAAA